MAGSLLVLGCDEDGASSAPDAAPPPPTMCEWPTGAVGLENGEVMAAAGTSWFGYGPGDTEPRTISIEEFYDCDGTHNIDALLFTTSKFNCGRCAREAQELEANIASWRAMGYRIKVITMLIDNPAGERDPNGEACGTWIDTYNLENVYVMGDPTVTFFTAGRFSTPMRAVVDPRDMTIQEIVQGSTPYTTLLPTAMRNNPDAMPIPPADGGTEG